MPHSRILFGFAAVAVTAACATPPPPSGTSASEVPPTVATSVEPTTPPTTTKTRKGDISISVPTLPIGGGTSDDSVATQCASASWLSELPSGVKITVTGIAVTPKGAFRVGGGCEGVPACRGFTFDAAHPQCSVQVTALGTGGGARLTLSGKCADSPGCRQVRDGRGGSIALRQPDAPESSPTTTTS